MQLLATLIIVAAQAAGKQSAAGVKYMLLDDRNIVSADAKLVLGAVVKHPANPMITEERYAGTPRRGARHLTEGLTEGRGSCSMLTYALNIDGF